MALRHLGATSGFAGRLQSSYQRQGKSTSRDCVPILLRASGGRVVGLVARTANVFDIYDTSEK